MKYSNLVGVAASVCVIISCFFPWAYIPVIETMVTGFYTGNTYFGKPGILHVVFCVVAITLYLLPAIWAKRTNIFAATFNFAWALRNTLVVSRCEMGECPERKYGMYLVIGFSLIMLVMALSPRVKLPREEN